MHQCIIIRVLPKFDVPNSNNHVRYAYFIFDNKIRTVRVFYEKNDVFLNYATPKKLICARKWWNFFL